MGTVTTQFVLKLAQAAGLQIDPCGRVTATDGTVFDIGPADGALSQKQYTQIALHILDHHPNLSALAMDYARAVDLDDFGALGLALKAAPTVRDSLLRIERYFPILSDTARQKLIEDPSGARFVLEWTTDPGPIERLRSEAALASYWAAMRQVTGEVLTLKRVTLRYSAPDDPSALLAYFGCEVEFEAPETALVIPAEVLDRKNVLGDPAMSRFLQAHLDAVLPSEPSFEQKLIQLMSGALSAGVPRARDVAGELGLSERSLHRRLAEQGQSFRVLLEHAQRQLAEGLLLQSQHSIAEIAFLTGFSEQSAFNRAFKRWTGQTPSAFRG